MSGTSLRTGPAPRRLAICAAICAAVCAGVALSAVLAGCGSVPKENFYTLSAVAAPGRAGNPDPASKHAIVVDVAMIPELVDRPQFVVTIGESRVAILEQQRWAEPLKTQISRTVAINLGRFLGTARASAIAAAAGDDDAYHVSLDVQRFEARTGEGVAVEVLWTVRRGAAGVATGGRTAAREKSGPGSYEALVAALDRALAVIGSDIAAAIRKLNLE